MQNTESVKTQERILGSAVDLFSKVGFNGTSTRDIARAAEVNEVTIYRYFPRKRDLFVAALETELSRISVRADLAARLACAPDAKAAIEHIFIAIDEVARQQPAMLRLVQFSALEMGEEMGPIYQKHLGSLLDLSVSYLHRWVELGQLRCTDPRLIILAFVATVIGIDTFFPLLWRKDRDLPDAQAGRTFARIWESALTPTLV